jgi:PhoH-like ATPase
MVKTYILDTNVLLHDPKSLFSFQDNEVVIPLVVLEELDKKKNGMDEVARNAREVIRSLDALRAIGNISKGVTTKDSGLIKIEMDYKDKIPSDLDSTKADNRIIGVALGLSNIGKQVILVTNDINLRVKCDALDVLAESYSTDKVIEYTDDIYSGFKELDVSSSYIDSFNEDGLIMPPDGVSFYENQYVLLRAIDVEKHSSLARFEHGKFVKIKCHSNVWGVNPKNKEQTCALDAIFNNNIKLVTLIGLAGSGKTLICVAAGLSLVFDSHTYKKLILAKAPVPLSKNMQLGFLPGGLDEKLDPWLNSVWDNMEFLFGDNGKNMIEEYREKGLIEVCSLEHIRGRSLRDCLVLLDESQNLDLHEIKTMITRAGENTKICCTGDVQQIDTKLTEANNGLSLVAEAFKGQDIAAHVTFHKGERSKLATLASELL